MRPRPSPLWYLVTVVMWVAAAIVAVIAFRPIVDIATQELTPVENGAKFPVSSDGFTLWVTDASSSTECTVTDGAGESTTLDAFDEDIDQEFTISIENGPDYTALANTPEDLAAGDYTLQCSEVRGEDLAIGDRVDLVGLLKNFGIGLLVAGILGLIGLVVLIVMLVKRHNSKKRIREYQAQAAYSSWPPQGGYPGGGGYPPPGDQTYTGYGRPPEPQQTPPPADPADTDRDNPPPSSYPPPPPPSSS